MATLKPNKPPVYNGDRDEFKVRTCIYQVQQYLLLSQVGNIVISKQLYFKNLFHLIVFNDQEINFENVFKKDLFQAIYLSFGIFLY